MKKTRIHHLPTTVPDILQRRLRTYGWLLKARDAAADLGLSFLILAAMLILGCAFDRLVDVPGTWRLPYSLLTAIITLALAVRFLMHLCRLFDFDAIAHMLDKASGDPRGHLRSVLDFSRRELPPDSFAGISAARAETLWKNLAPATYMDRRPLRWPLLAFAVLMMMAGISRIESVRSGLLLQRFADPLGNYMRPTATWLEVEAPPREGIRGGDDFTIRARLRGRTLPDPVPLACVSFNGESATFKRMCLQNGVWELPLTDVRLDVSFELTLGAARSAKYRISVMPRPQIEKISVVHQPPKYTRLPDRQEILPGRTIVALDGTKLRIELSCNVPLKSVTGRIEKDQQLFTVDSKDPRKAFCFRYVSANERMDLSLLGRNGLDNNKELPLNFRVVPDNPPVIVAINDPSDKPLFPNETLVIGFKAQDDIGLSEVSLISVRGDFSQEADLEKQGLREASGTLRIPVSRLLQPGANSAKVRLSALDGKGQRGSSPAMTIKIAVNSYERQLRAAMRALTSPHRNTGGRSPNADELGFPSLDRHAKRLASLRSLNSKLTMLREFISGKPDDSQAKMASDVRKLLTELDPGFPYLVPYVTPGHGSERSIDILGRMPLSIRLQKIVRDASCGAELAVPTEALAAAFETALVSPDPKAALAGLQTDLGPIIARQETVTRRLDDFQHTLQLELAGYLATQLSRATYAGAERDIIVVNSARLKELAGLLVGPLSQSGEKAGGGLLSDEQKATLAGILKNQNETEALTQAAVFLKGVLPKLEAMAAEHARNVEIQELPVSDFLAALASHPGTDWREVYALWVNIQSDDNDVDEELLLHHCQALLRLAAGKPFAPPAPASPGDVQARALKLGCLLSRIADQAAALRISFLNGQAQANPPALEASWLRLRELVFSLVPLIGKEDAGLEKFLAGLEATRSWLPATESVSSLPAALAVWEKEARSLAAGYEPAARQRLNALCQEAGSWPQDASSAVASYLKEIDVQIQALEKEQTSRVAHEALPKLNERLNVLSNTMLKTFDIAEAARLHGVETSLDLNRLAALRVALQKVQEHLREKVGAVGGTIGGGASASASPEELKAMERTLATGKVRTFQQHRELAGGLGNLCAPTADAALLESILKAQAAWHLFELERKEYESALSIASSPPVPAATLLSVPGSERTSSPAFWGDVTGILADLQQAISEKNMEAQKKNLEILRARLSGIPTLPREARSLVGWPERTPESLQADGPGCRQELGAILEELRPLAQVPAVYPGDERIEQQRQAMWLARLHLNAQDLTTKVALAWALTDLEWSRRKREAGRSKVGIGGLQAAGEDEMDNLKLPRHLYLELKRAREGVMPELYRERSHKYLNNILERAR